jgi:hypothetical protein
MYMFLWSTVQDCYNGGILKISEACKRGSTVDTYINIIYILCTYTLCMYIHIYIIILRLDLSVRLCIYDLRGYKR